MLYGNRPVLACSLLCIMDSVFCEQTDPGDEVTEPGSEEYSDNEYGVGITLDTTVLDNVGQVHTSLTDQNGISLFTNEYEGSVRLETEENRQIRLEQYASLFQSSTILPEDVYQHVRNSLFIEDEIQMVRQESRRETNSGRIIIISIALAMIIVIATVLFFFRTRRREKEKNESDIYAYD